MKLALTLALAGSLLVAAGTTVASGRPMQAQPNKQCMALIAANGLPLASPKAEWLANYHGCNKTYDANGNLTGYGRGTSRCERLAWHLTMQRHLTGLALHQRMAGICVLYEDWAWGAE